MTKSAGTFLYFAYGSNLLAERIHVQNPSAVRRCAAKINDYRLDFNRHAERWGGCSATVVKEKGKHVWGAVWEIDLANSEDLNRQEGVSDGVYRPLQVEAVTPDEKTLECRVYQLIQEPEPYKSSELLPNERRPSRIYLEVILQGAIESKLPQEYIDFLKTFPHNGYVGPVQVPGLAVDFSVTRPNS